MPCMLTEVRCTQVVRKLAMEGCGIRGAFAWLEARSKHRTSNCDCSAQHFIAVMTHLGAMSTLRFCTPAEYVKVCAATASIGGLEDPLSSSALQRFAANICSEPTEQITNLQNAAHFGDRLTLHRAAETGQLDVVWAFILLGSNINHFDVYGSTPLHCAAAGSHLNICRFLVQAGASIDEKFKGHNTRSGWTALHFAASAGAYDVVKFLLQEGANVNASDSFERTPFSCAKDRGCRGDILGLLLDWEAVDSELKAGSATKFPFAFDTRGYDIDLADYD